MQRLIAVLSLAMSAPLVSQSSQGIVSPGHFATAEGNYYSNVPFGTTTTPYRYLQVHDDLANQPRTISRISLRRDGLQTGDSKPGTMLVDIYLSTAKTAAKTVSKTFDANHGDDKVQVAAARSVQFPASTHSGLRPDFAFHVPFDKPFVFGGQGGLCWETRIHGRQLGSSIYFDSAYGQNSNPAPTELLTGTGCKAPGQSSVMRHDSSASASWSTKSMNFSMTVSNGPKNGLAIVALGLTDKNLGPLPLPLELPDTRGSASGPCSLYLDPFFFLPVATDASGAGTYGLSLPAKPDMNGVQVFSQAFAPVIAANPLGLVTSNLVTNMWVAPWTSVPAGTVSATSLATDGTASANSGLVVRFE